MWHCLWRYLWQKSLSTNGVFTRFAERVALWHIFPPYIRYIRKYIKFPRLIIKNFLDEIMCECVPQCHNTL